MFKNLISPIQLWLLSQGRCVGCGDELSKAVKTTNNQGVTLYSCRCGRIFIHEVKPDRFRRALFDEV